MIGLLQVLLLASFAQFEPVLGISNFTERLNLRSLPSSALLASFHFGSITSRIDFNSHNFNLFPRSLGQILQHAHSSELHLRFSSGRWNDELWGARPWQGFTEGVNGVELWAFVEGSTELEAQSRWLTLTNALSGLFCASLNFIDASRTIQPAFAFLPFDRGDGSFENSKHLLHGVLPAEVVCTENLTPFLKLLPCKGKAGISTLLDGHKLFDSSWQTMSIDVQSDCSSGSEDCSIEIHQSIDLVLDILRSQRPKDNPIPAPRSIDDMTCDMTKSYNVYSDSCFPLSASSSSPFTISSIFGKPVQGSCPLADNDVSLETPVCLENFDGHNVTTINTTQVWGQEKDNCFNVPANDVFDLEVSNGPETTKLSRAPSMVFTQRTLRGRGQQRGGIRTTISNPSAEYAVRIEYLETLPWFVKPYLHSLRVQIAALDGSSAGRSTSAIVEKLFYRPAIDRQRGNHLEFVMIVPPRKTLTIHYNFEKSVLRYTEYPPDANRGFNAASAIIRAQKQSRHTSEDYAYVRSSGLLLYLPTPDFSMPYNVIILSSTVLALAFGSIFNFLIRRFATAEEATNTGLLRLFSR